MIKLTTLEVIGTDCLGSCKSNYHHDHYGLTYIIGSTHFFIGITYSNLYILQPIQHVVAISLHVRIKGVFLRRGPVTGTMIVMTTQMK